MRANLRVNGGIACNYLFGVDVSPLLWRRYADGYSGDANENLTR